MVEELVHLKEMMASVNELQEEFIRSLIVGRIYEIKIDVNERLLIGSFKTVTHSYIDLETNWVHYASNYEVSVGNCQSVYLSKTLSIRPVKLPEDLPLYIDMSWQSPQFKTIISTCLQ
jgi:hypothetical protein